MTLVYFTLAWIAGILLAYALWLQGFIGCATPGWPFGALAAIAGAHRRFCCAVGRPFSLLP